MRLYFWFILSLSPLLFGSYAIDSKCENPNIQYIQLFGERCSGTNYLEQLFNSNFPEYPFRYTFGEKHYPAWYDGSHIDQAIPKYCISLEGNESYLFLVIVRNPLDWLQSFYMKPCYGVSRWVNCSSFSSFIRSLWYYDQCPYDKPHDKPFFSNVLELRSARLRNLLTMRDKVSNYYFIRYETVRDHPEEVIREVSSLFSMKCTPDFHPFTKAVRGTSGVTNVEFAPISYPAVNEEDRTFILEHLDLDVENFMGYDGV